MKRILAQRERGLRLVSALEGRMGFLVRSFAGGSSLSSGSGPSRGAIVDESCLNPCFTIRSSRLWKVIMPKRPSGFSRAVASGMVFSSTPSSLLTSMRRA